MTLRTFHPLLLVALTWSVLAAALTGEQSAEAATATDTFQVTASVTAACSVTANDLNFGAYDPLSASPTDSSSSLSVTCTLSTPYRIGLDKGQGAGATITNRKMTSGTQTLTYSLYQDAARDVVWGDTVPTSVSGIGTGNAQGYTVYGRIPAQQIVPPSTYTDTILVTVTF